MKTGTYDSSYDRHQAVGLARQLHRRFQKSRGILLSAHGDESEMVQPVSPTEPEPHPRAPSVSFEDREVYREEVWKALLDWAMSLSTSRWAYVSDERGLIIAEKGDRGSLNTEETASRIANAVHSLRHSGGEIRVPRVVSLKTSGGWITALSCPFKDPSDEKSHLIIGLLGELPPVADISEKIHGVFSEKISAF